LKFACKFILFAKSTNKQSKTYAKTFNFLCAGVKDFVKYQDQGVFNPNPLRTPLPFYIYKTVFNKEKNK